MRGATKLDHQVKDILKNQSAEPKLFTHHFFFSCFQIRNSLDPNLQNTDLYKKFKDKILSFIKIKSNSVFSVRDVYGVKPLFRLRVHFSHLNAHKVCHGFKDRTNSVCDCGSATETTLHFLLQYQQYQRRLELLNSIYNLDPKIRNLMINFCTYYYTD